MTAPQLAVQQSGIGVVGADNYNTYAQTCDNVAQLRAFVGTQGVQVFVRGIGTPGDGGDGGFWWNAGATGAVDDGVNTIVPTGASSGAWLRLSNVTQRYSYQVPVTGFAITIPSGVEALILNPAGALATGALTLPSSPLDGQSVRISSSQAVTALTVGAGAATVNNSPTAMTAATPFGFIYVASAATWFRI